MPSIEDLRELLAMPKAQQVACLKFWQRADPCTFAEFAVSLFVERLRRKACA